MYEPDKPSKLKIGQGMEYVSNYLPQKVENISFSSILFVAILGYSKDKRWRMVKIILVGMIQLLDAFLCKEINDLKAYESEKKRRKITQRALYLCVEQKFW